MRGEGVTGEAGGAQGGRPAGAIATVGIVVCVAWCAAVATGLGRALLGSEAAAGPAGFALYLPGALVGAALLAWAAWRRLVAAAPRWVPRAALEATAAVVEVSAEEDEEGTIGERGPEVVARAAREGGTAGGGVRAAAPAAPGIVHLGPGVDPAWAAWGLAWEAPGHGAGLVPLPSGARVIVGRDPASHVVVRLDQVSWQHLELDVQEGRVVAFDVGSKNGTRSAPDGEALPARTPLAWAPGEALHLAHPVALTLRLEPLR